MDATITCSYANPMVLDKGVLALATSKDSGAFQFGSSTCSALSQGSSTTSTVQSVYDGFTYGEIVISFFAFAAVLILAYAFLWFSVKGFKIRQ
jgi:hypothetical protein